MSELHHLLRSCHCNESVDLKSQRMSFETQIHFHEIVNNFRCSSRHDPVYVNYREIGCGNRLTDTK